MSFIDQANASLRNNDARSRRVKTPDPKLRVPDARGYERLPHLPERSDEGARGRGTLLLIVALMLAMLVLFLVFY